MIPTINRRRGLILSLLFVANLAQAEMGAGDSLAYPPTVVLTEAWLYNTRVPVYQVHITNAGKQAELLAAKAAVASVRPEFKTFDSKFILTLDNYVVGRTDSGSDTTIYIRRSIIADWLMAS